MKKEETKIISPTPTNFSKRITSGYKNQQNRETFGKIYLDWRKSLDGNEVAVEDVGKAGTRSTMEEVWICVQRGISALGSVPFYVGLYMRPEKLMPGFGRQQFVYLEACPTPSYLQAIWRYEPQHNKLTYLWSLPTKQRCIDMYNNKQLVPPAEYEMLAHVIDFFDGTLDKLVNQLNNEPYLDPRSNEF